MSGKKPGFITKVCNLTLGNRRLRAYIFAIIKFTAVCMIQAYESFPKDSSIYYYRYILQSLGYTWLIILLTLFTERYVRELIANYRKKEIAIWLNWVEMTLFTVYTVYATVIGCLYFWAVSVKAEYLGPVKSVIYAMNEVIILLAIYEKWTHFLHAGHSVSLYCATEQHIPPHAHEDDAHDDHDDDHGHGHDDGHHGHEEGHHGHGHEEKHHEGHGNEHHIQEVKVDHGHH